MTKNNQFTTTQTPVAPTTVRTHLPRRRAYSVGTLVDDTKSIIDDSEKVTLVTEIENNNSKK
ncbi:hypothetical protein [Candidatus Enterovibrio escicola]|uniref:hypothetical protein n=1 Tax=Candidatus Enterovibrio escicola TaxID=1927127 RepID=UPI001237E354|nr:hypothetical protein [Candidatus Enterovibrio escacola]